MPDATLYLIAPPDQQHGAAATGLPLIHPLYRVLRGRLTRMGPAVPPTGGWLLLGGPITGSLSPQALAQSLGAECAARGYEGILLDPTGPVTPLLRGLVPLLERMAIQRGLLLYLTEAYASLATQAGVVISSALSGGSLAQRIAQAQETYGPHRVGLTLQPVREDFPLPAPTGAGRPLTGEQLAALRRQHNAPVFYAAPLCAQYFTYLSGNRGRLVLFDDAASLERKRALAQQLGVRRLFLSYPQGAELGFLPSPPA